MSLRPLLLSILMTLFILPVSGQETAGSNIVSRTLLLSDGSKSIEQRVYNNGPNHRDRFEVNPESWTQLKGSNEKGI